MPKSNLPGFPGLCVLLGIAVCLAAFSLGEARGQTETETETEATVDRCRTAFGSSSAAATCNMSRLGVEIHHEKCWFKTICATNQAFTGRITSITVILEDASRLSNCNGHLTVGSC